MKIGNRLPQVRAGSFNIHKRNFHYSSYNVFLSHDTIKCESLYEIDRLYCLLSFMKQMRASTNSHALSSWECSGHFVFKSRNDFDQVTEEAMLERMGTASLDEPGFQVVKQLCCSIASKLAS